MMVKFALVLTLVMIMMMKIFIPMISLHKILNREKMSPFECGFDILSKSRVSFSIQFFTIALMFLIFDIEISILLPLPLSINLVSLKIFMTSTILLMTALLWGVMIEWKEGSMNWS